MTETATVPKQEDAATLMRERVEAALVEVLMVSSAITKLSDILDHVEDAVVEMAEPGDAGGVNHLYLRYQAKIPLALNKVSEGLAEIQVELENLDKRVKFRRMREGL